MSEEEKEIEKTQEEINAEKSNGAKRRWELQKDRTNGLGVDRSGEKFDYKCFENLHLSKMQKKFVVKYMDPPYLGKKEFRFEVYKQVYNPSNENSLKSNCSVLLAKPKIKEAMRLYQIYSLQNHKQEVTSESIENYRKRATYTMDMFFYKDGKPKPLDEIPAEWLICIDNIDRKLSTKSEQEIINYKLCDRDKAMSQLEKLLNIYTETEKIEIPIPGSGKGAIENAEDSVAVGPRIVLNMSVGNPFEKKEE